MDMSVRVESLRLRPEAVTNVRTLPVTEAEIVGQRLLTQDLATAAPLLLADLMSVLVVWTVHALVCAQFALDTGSTARALALSSLILFPLVNFFMGLYPGVCLIPAEELKRTLLSVMIIAANFAVIEYWAGLPNAASAVSFSFGVSLFLIALVSRLIVRRICGKYSWWLQPTIVIGNWVDQATCRRWMDACPELGLRWTDDDVPCRAILTENGCDEFDCSLDELLMRLPKITPVSSVQLQQAETTAEGSAILAGPCLKNRLLMPHYRIAKRMFDLSLVVMATPALLCIASVLAVMIKASSPGPVFYSQYRPGKNGVRFRTWKYRTMVVGAEEILEEYLATDHDSKREWEQFGKLKNDPRITPVGRLLRRTSLDELPQVWNVIRGEMTLVGPRPIVESQIAAYGEAYHMYIAARPGLTGLWQTSGRSNTTHSERVAYDAHYVRNWSPWYDMYLMMRTVRAVASGDGAY
jgi:lipopolysaccharide/colanic/teichoic acid biosynthesis glycosyltransferase